MRLLIPLFFLLFLGLGSCYKGVDGCNDPTARNFNPEADNFTTCDYYDLILNTKHWWNGQDLRFDTSYLDASGDTFRIVKAQFLFSDLKLVRANGTKVGVREQMEIQNSSGNSSQVEQNVFLISAGTNTYTIGSLIGKETFPAVTLRQGLPGYLNASNPTTYRASFILSDNYGLWQSYAEGYALQYWIVRRGYPNSVLDTFIVKQSSSELRMDSTVSVVDGKDLALNMDINYSQMLRDVSFDRLSKDSIQARLSRNLPGVCTLKRPR